MGGHTHTHSRTRAGGGSVGPISPTAVLVAIAAISCSAHSSGCWERAHRSEGEATETAAKGSGEEGKEERAPGLVVEVRVSDQHVVAELGPVDLLLQRLLHGRHRPEEMAV